MNIEELREYCLSLRNVTECLPFGDGSLVFKVENKMFALIPLDAFDPYISVKCDPDTALELRERYNAVEQAYHFNKKYWNGIYLERDMPKDEIKQWVLNSYQEVIMKLPKKIREAYDITGE